MKFNKKMYEEFLNEIGIPEDEKKSNGGRCPDYRKYGTWMRNANPIGFEAGFIDESITRGSNNGT